jgi:hypothetical protein
VVAFDQRKCDDKTGQLDWQGVRIFSNAEGTLPLECKFGWLAVLSTKEGWPFFCMKIKDNIDPEFVQDVYIVQYKNFRLRWESKQCLTKQDSAGQEETTHHRFMHETWLMAEDLSIAPMISCDSYVKDGSVADSTTASGDETVPSGSTLDDAGKEIPREGMLCVCIPGYVVHPYVPTRCIRMETVGKSMVNCLRAKKKMPE